MRALTVGVLLSASLAGAQVTKTSAQVTVPNCGSAPATHQVDVYRPAGAGPFPLVALGHGFQNSNDNFEGLAQALAATGVVVVAPQFPSLLTSACGSDHARNGRVLLAAIDQQVMRGDIDTARIGVGGHSAGGLSAFLAASQRQVAAVMLFDPVDNSNLGVMAVSMVTAPTIFLFAEPAQCNSQANAVPWFTAMTGPRARLKVVNANHCDPQEPISGICTIGCGGMGATSTARQAVFKRYALAFFARYLRGVTSPCLETTAQTDATAGVVAQVDFRLGGCGGGSDAGTVVDAGTPVDAGTAVDAGTVIDAGMPVDAGSLGDAGTTEPDAGAPVTNDGGAGGSGGGAGSGGGGGTSFAPDAGDGVGVMPPGGCGCTAVDPLVVLGGVVFVFASRRRRKGDVFVRS